MGELSKEPDEHLLRRIKRQKNIIKFLVVLLIFFLIVTIWNDYQYLTVPSISYITQVFHLDVSLKKAEEPTAVPVLIHLPIPVKTTTPLPGTTKKSTPKATPVSEGEIEKYIVDTEGCKIPDLHPFGQWRQTRKVSSMICETGFIPLISSNDSAIFVNPKARQLYYPDSQKINCCWRPFYRSLNGDKSVLFQKTCNYFEESAEIRQFFIKVECRLPDNTTYDDYFAFVKPKFNVEQRSHEFTASSGSTTKKLNVLVVGMNSVSRLNLYRSMPSTVELLNKIGAIDMLGYNKVGYDGYQNLVPMLSGLPHAVFENVCRPSPKKTFDMCPFVWNKFAARGYRTIFAEDNCKLDVFNYLKQGFRFQPTDYYYRPMCIAASSGLARAKDCDTFRYRGTLYLLDKLLDYTRRVAAEFKDKPYFALTWQSGLTHDFMSDASLADDLYYGLLTDLHDKGLLQDTALLFMSDHGMLWGRYRWTYQGRLEENLPFAFVKMPEWWKQQHPGAWRNLKQNSKRLITPFDFYETFRDILEPERLNNIENNIPPNYYNAIPTGYGVSTRYGNSLFKPILENRTCETAGIPDHWCSCHHRHKVSKSNSTLYAMGNFLVSKINKLIDIHKKCAKLQLASIVDAKIVNNNEFFEQLKSMEVDTYLNVDDTFKWTDYSLTFKTKPGNGIFEGTVRRRDDSSMRLIGSISRMNEYVNQSSCVNSFDLRFYCSCETHEKYL